MGISITASAEEGLRKILCLWAHVLAGSAGDALSCWCPGIMPVQEQGLSRLLAAAGGECWWAAVSAGVPLRLFCASCTLGGIILAHGCAKGTWCCLRVAWSENKVRKPTWLLQVHFSEIQIVMSEFQTKPV